MKKYKHYYWLLDQRFDFLIPWFQAYFGIEERKDIAFVGSFHGSSRKVREWEGVTKELVGKSLDGEPVYIGQDAESDEAQWLEPDDINRAYGNRIQDNAFAAAFTGAGLPECVDSFILTGAVAAKLNNKWEQYQLLSNREGILTPKTVRIDQEEYEAAKRKEALKKEVSFMRSSAGCGKVILKRPDLSGGFRMQVIADDRDFEKYCSLSGGEALKGQLLISEYIPHEQSFAGIGIVGRQNGRPEVSFCGITEQVLYHELAYEGLIWPPFWNTESGRSVQAGKDEIENITGKIGWILAEQGYFGFYNVDFVEEENTGRMYAIEINARFGFSTLLYALYCGKDSFFDAVLGRRPPVMDENSSDGARRLLGKIKGIPGKSYRDLSNMSDIESWFADKGRFRACYLREEVYKYGSFAGLFGETISMEVDRRTAIARFMDSCLLRDRG